VIVGVSLALRFVPGWVVPSTLVHFIGLGIGPLLGILGLIVWWLFCRGVRFRERLAGVAIALGALVLTFIAADPTMPQALVTYAFPALMAVFVAALFVTRAVPWPQRRWILVASLALGLLPWMAVRQDGQVGDLLPHFSARWSATAEDRFLAQRSGSPAAMLAELQEGIAAESDWPGFRGPSRDGRVPGITFDTNWQDSPPRELWRRLVGPGWSSFAVAGERVFTQEQRGDEEVVVSYSLHDGGELWVQGTRERFEEPAAGPGPRATPTVAHGRIYTLGANGTVQSLAAATGERHWQRNLQDDVQAPLPDWGFSSSPLVTENAVIVFAGAPEGKALVAYDRETGELLWASGKGTYSYSSGHPARIGGDDQVLIATNYGLQALDAGDGRIVWEHAWPTTGMPRIVQPVVLDGGDSVILATGYGYGSRRLDIERAGERDWSVSEAWSSRFLKPYFNDLVCHRGTCYGFDGKILTAIDATDGERRWKGGRYGHGQLVLISDMDMLLVIAETGEVVLVEATPEAHREVARFQALEGKTWNHPVVTQGKLLLRNAEEAVCYELPNGVPSS